MYPLRWPAEGPGSTGYKVHFKKKNILNAIKETSSKNNLMKIRTKIIVRK
jgi:hypothetical protein